MRRNPVFVTCTVVVNLFLLIGAVIKIWSVVIEAEDDYNDVRSQVEICFTGIGRIVAAPRWCNLLELQTNLREVISCIITDLCFGLTAL